MARNVTAVFGVSESRSAYEASKIIKENNGKFLVITASEGRAREIAEDISYFAERKVMSMPHEDNFFLGYEARDHEQLMKRLREEDLQSTSQQLQTTTQVDHQQSRL